LADNPELAQSLRNRIPYPDPLNHLQIELLRRYRAGDTDELTRRGIHLCINGLTAGLRCPAWPPVSNSGGSIARPTCPAISSPSSESRFAYCRTNALAKMVPGSRSY
ncbi:MAG: phosphoenolpyruvate carboxylase, partial [Acidobacteriota bacterium]|nr:phosphoenolpyruvate carboxylase [Acidobacteriota bacterium]